MVTKQFLVPGLWFLVSAHPIAKMKKELNNLSASKEIGDHIQKAPSLNNKPET